MLSKSSLRQRAAGTSATVASAEVLLSDIGSYLLGFTSRPVIIPRWEADREKSMLQTRNSLNYTLSASGHAAGCHPPRKKTTYTGFVSASRGSRVPRPLLYLPIVLALGSATGCGSEPRVTAAQPQQPAPPGPELASSFEAHICGSISGYVSWSGAIPEVSPVQAIRPRGDGSGYDSLMLTLPTAPKIDRFTRGVAGAVVFLRNVKLPESRPWDLKPVSVEIRDHQIMVMHGDRTGRTGIVQRGASVAMQSGEAEFHVLRGRGVAFFALPFPEPHQPLTRTFDTPGRVVLTSAAGHHWQYAELFVCTHPYYAVTEHDGRFSFAQIPPGRYDLVAWHPNWTITRIERNPESGLPSQLHYAPPLETTRSVLVLPHRNTVANLNLPK